MEHSDIPADKACTRRLLLPDVLYMGPVFGYTWAPRVEESGNFCHKGQLTTVLQSVEHLFGITSEALENRAENLQDNSNKQKA